MQVGLKAPWVLVQTLQMLCSMNLSPASVAHFPLPSSSIVERATFRPDFMFPATLTQGIASFMIVDESMQQHAGDGWREDRVIRVLDANTIKLEKTGLVSLGAIKTPQSSGINSFEFSECLTRSPSYKLKQLLSKNEKVRVKKASSGSSGSPQAIIIRTSDRLIVNEELVRAGFAQVRKNNLFPSVLSTAELVLLEDRAREEGRGLFQRCNNGADVFEAQFEPLDVTTETRWGNDGGTTVLRYRDTASASPPSNPGDKVGCSNFVYYEDALNYYEKFYLFYGDIAKLDRDGDGVPCPGLRHTPNAERYRMKIPKAQPSQ
jgi:endonuclease YncB( thermonuclease family)